MGVSASLLLLALALATTAVMLMIAVAIPASPQMRDFVAAAQEDLRPRLRMLGRLLFSRRQPDSITLDCLVVSVEKQTAGIAPPAGQPFTLQLRAPETVWFAERVEQLLSEWAADSRELLLELTEDHGKVRTMITSNGSSVHLELAGAAGLPIQR